MGPFPPLPPALDPFARLGPLASAVEPLVRFLRLPLELLYAALVLPANPNGPAAMAAATAGLGQFVQLLFVVVLVLLAVALLLLVVVALGAGAVLWGVARRLRRG